MTTTNRAIKSTSITFGLVNVLVKLHKATDSHDISFHQHHEGCGGAVGIKRVCKACEQEVPYANIVKGIEHEGSLVIVAPEELKALQDEVPAVEVVQFIDVAEIDPLTYEQSYYVEPQKTSMEGYALLRTVLVNTGRAGLVKFALRDRLHLGVLRVAGDVLVIHTIAHGRGPHPGVLPAGREPQAADGGDGDRPGRCHDRPVRRIGVDRHLHRSRRGTHRAQG